jgi:FkbM family methyltransferase
MKRTLTASIALALILLSVTACKKSNWLIEKYGPKLYSQYDEELIIRDFFQDKKGGSFVDIGANDYKVDSTTYYLEEKLGWHGIAVDALCSFEEGYLEHRKNTRFFCFFVSDKSDANVDFYITQKKYGRRSSANPKWAKEWDLTKKTVVPTIMLNDLLEKEGFGPFDFLSMDIELAEPAALAGFDIEKYHPGLVCIELHKEVRQFISDYFAKHGYVVVEKYKDVDKGNTYFAPLR